MFSVWRFVGAVEFAWATANNSGEYYLTDVVGLLRAAGQRVVGELVAPREMTGINTKSELAALDAQLQSEALGLAQSEAQPS